MALTLPEIGRLAHLARLEFTPEESQQLLSQLNGFFDTVEQMRAALAAAGNTSSQIIVYPDADHGFFADYRPTYNEAAAKDAWARSKAWFKRYLK